ncbi:PREDICTED: protein KASH5 [Gekko japonicus]|uniref:Protein KASH5 n=1 Tax=Gekko japonicus TaxID=146911 RepID=A0ABM1KJX0_GEKJA|nr:PREDICTED: protein KASH5 [Gekko japonicus]
MNSIKDLQQGNKQLAMQNIKLQRTIETAEELNLRLSEEIAELKGKLRGTQQATEQARALANELEDLKFFSKSLEEENSKLHTQGRQLEKEQQCLLIHIDNLQEENRKFLLEKESCKNKIKQLCTEKAQMKSQLCECENLISCKETDLNKKERRTEELTETLDEYQMMVQELKLEVHRLQEQLCHSCGNGEGLPRNSLENVKTCCVQAPVQPLSVEIEESQKEFGEEDGLPSPLYGTLPSFVTHAVAPEECRALTEDLDECTNLPEITGVSSAEFGCEPAPEEQALVLVHHQLVPTGGKKLCNRWLASLTEWFLDVPLGYLLLLILQKLVLLGLLLACVSLLTIVYLVPPYGHHLVWVEPRGNPWPHLQLRHLRPPPV